ncbi:MAG: hypothetical protein K2L54_02240 [Clostridiales bacterium]|nr:hypothetical protein [Clostridiales bacterium]
MSKFIEVTDLNDKLRRLIAVERIISVIEQPDHRVFIEFYEAVKSTFPCGIYCAEGYEKIKCMLVDIFEVTA